MAHYRCQQCFAEGDDPTGLDHAHGLIIGRPCAGGKAAPVVEVGGKPKPKAATAEPTEIPKTKSKKSKK